MDSRSCQSSAIGPRPQRPAPPCMNTNCDRDCRPPRPAGSGDRMRPPMQSGRPLSMGGCGSSWNNNNGIFPASTPIGMGYVPMQQWGAVYPPDTALQRGTIFPELDLPFQMGRCHP